LCELRNMIAAAYLVIKPGRDTKAPAGAALDAGNVYKKF